MNNSVFRINLDLNRHQSQVSLPVFLGDKSREIRANICYGSQPYIIEDGCLAMIAIKRPGGTRLEDFCPIEDKSTVVYAFSENTAAEPGVHDCDIKIIGADGGIIGTARFVMVVSERAVPSDDIVVTAEDYTAVDAMLAQEAQRQTAEAERVSAEAERASASVDNSSAETERVTAEAARVAAEVKRVSAESGRVIAEAERVAKDAERDTKINKAVSDSAEAVETAGEALEIAESVSGVVGGGAIIDFSTVVEAVNQAVATANAAKSQSDATRTNLINLSAQVQGIGRTYVISGYIPGLLDFLSSDASITLSEDRDGDGADETYTIYASDLNTGDNLLITQSDVPDLWVEMNSSGVADTIEIGGTEYELNITKNGAKIGVAHVLETDITVLEGYATSARASATDSAASAAAALVSESNAKASEQAVEEAFRRGTPYIGDDGYWYIGDTSTGVKAAGEDGADGQDGEDGADGAVGNGIASIELVSTTAVNGRTVKEYKITFTDGTEYSYTVTDGKDGVNGANGADGEPYVLTEADKTEIVNSVLAELPYYDGSVDIEGGSTEDPLAGTWVLNDELTDINPGDNMWEYSVNFVSTNTDYTRFANFSGIPAKDYMLYYGNLQVYGSGSWRYGDSYKTITITSNLADVTDGDILLTWLQANATKQ